MLSGKEPFTAPGFSLAFRDDSDGGDLDFLEEDCVKDVRAMLNQRDKVDTAFAVVLRRVSRLTIVRRH